MAPWSSGRTSRPLAYIIRAVAAEIRGVPGRSQGEPMPIPLPTTIAGSLPKPSWLAPPNQLWAPWLLEGAQLAEAKRDAVRLVVCDQEHAGIDIVTDGEQTRRHFVTTFIENLDGVDFEHKKTVRIRNRYDADVPMVVGPVARRGPVFVDDAAFLRTLTTRRCRSSSGPSRDGTRFSSKTPGSCAARPNARPNTPSPGR